MVLLPWTRGHDRRTAEELYGAIVAQARGKAFFGAGGVADTPEGRAGMIMIHLFLVLDRLLRDGPAGKKLGRCLTEVFVSDIDDCLREMGVGDLAVPNKVKEAAAGLYERCHAYRRLLAPGGERGLVPEFAATIPGLENSAENALHLIRYMRLCRGHLAGLSRDAVLNGQLTFLAHDTMIGETNGSLESGS